jgi:hypothetical protein
MNNATYFLLGIIVTLICSFIPFILSSRQLSKEAKRIIELSTLIIRGIEESGLAKFNRNEKGEPIGMIFNLTLSDSLHLEDSVKLSSHQSPETRPKV